MVLKEPRISYENVYYSGSGRPRRLFVAGLHGEEWKYTSDLLLSLDEPEIGSSYKVPVISKGRYISTLDHRYYESDGAVVIKLVKEIKPDVYIELHSYKKESFENLVDKDRLLKKGVPSYVELENGVLIGSVSPYLIEYFSDRSLHLSFEIEKNNMRSSRELLKILNVVNDTTADDFLDYISKKYPYAIEKAIEGYIKYHQLYNLKE